MMENQRVEEQCSRCLGFHGHHHMGCPELTGADEKVTTDAPTPAVDTLSDDIPENYDEFGSGVCDERNPAEGNNELPPPAIEGEGVEFEEGKQAGAEMLSRVDDEFDEQKTPPTDDDIQSGALLWLVAKVCHEVNRAFCREVLMDHSHLPWYDAPEWQRESAYNGVLMHFEDPDATPEASHISWMEQKRAEGWSYGNVKDVDAKTHPCLLPYHQLHAHDRAKDHLFAAVCKSMFGE